jgi:hypothetical protein
MGWLGLFIINIGLLAFHKYIHRNKTNIIHQLFLLPTANEPCAQELNPGIQVANI